MNKICSPVPRGDGHLLDPRCSAAEDTSQTAFTTNSLGMITIAPLSAIVG